MAWNAYLSTLSHAPVFDTDGLLGIIDQALAVLDSFLPAGTVVRPPPVLGFRVFKRVGLLGIINQALAVLDSAPLPLSTSAPPWCAVRVEGAEDGGLQRRGPPFDAQAAVVFHPEPQVLRALQENIEAALRMGASSGVGHGLEGLKFDIPRSITLEPTRTLLDMLPMLRNTLDAVQSSDHVHAVLDMLPVLRNTLDAAQ